jgi:uncharacterized protein YggE
MLCLLLGTAAGGFRLASAQSSPPDNTVTVDGVGIVDAPPDTAIVQLGVSVQAGTVAAASAQAATAASAVIAAVKADGVADADIQTQQFTISPIYDNQTITGYTVTNVLQVKVRAIDRVGQLVDHAVAAGGNAAVVQGITFTIDDTSALAHQARQLAMSDAKAKADDFAAAAGLTAGRAVQIIETSAPEPPRVLAAPAAARPGATFTPVQGGTLQVRVQVTVSYVLQ